MTFDVVVVGGGFAGVAAARDLSGAGRSVCVLEARDRLGGRTWYRRFAGADTEVELGGAWFSLARQPPLEEEVERYGVRVAPVPDRRTARWHTAGTTRSGLPVPQAEGIAFERALRAVWLASGRVELCRPLRDQGLESVDVSVASWVDQVAPATRDFLLGWASFMSGAHPADVSLLEFLVLFAANGGELWSLYDEIGECFADGTRSLLDAMVTDAQAEIRLGSEVVAISERDDDVAVTTGDGTEVRAGEAVVAVPVNTLDAIAFDPPLDPGAARIAAVGHPGRSLKVWALAESVPAGLLGIGFGTPLQWLSAEAQVEGGTLLVGFAYEGSGLNPTDRASVEAAVQTYVPDARVLAVDSHDWVGDPWSRGTWMVARPGWLTGSDLDGFAAERRRAVLAGSDLAAEHGGWIAGAIASGRAAARQVLARSDATRSARV